PRRLHVILARLLKAAAQHAEPALVVQRVLRVLEAIGARASYLALLKEQPSALDRVFAVALADLTGCLPLMRVSDRLTDIAELIIQCCMDLAWQQMTQTYGVPYCGEELGRLRPVVVAVAGYGKLGGLELGYA